jgi:hypothetical protein
MRTLFFAVSCTGARNATLHVAWMQFEKGLIVVLLVSVHREFSTLLAVADCKSAGWDLISRSDVDYSSLS